MKLRNNFEVGDKILILHANEKNPLRKNDIGKIGTILDKRCSFCIVHLDGDDRDKNYNYGTFAKVTGATVKDTDYNTVEEALEAVAKANPSATSLSVDPYYSKVMKKWFGKVVADKMSVVAYIKFKTQTYSK